MDMLFDNKRTFITKDGDEMLNLFTPTVDINDIKINGYIRVNNDSKGRIDKFVYTNVSRDYDAIDILMYANQIYNPFSIDEGDILYTPVYNDKLYSTQEEPTLPDDTKLSTKNEKTLTYAESVELLAKKGKGWI
jgi:hypothetical protein